ncbi:EAL domain-containing protein [Shewanella waksmanii]|uniref:EAL domain-containing protein n=1 Tax=Shewanella waksmanii TaxID=213783 RepID=UPI00048A46EA|nr:EAL domain-containing protein [Shewanella waksmanii]
MPNALLKLVLTLFITCLSLTVARAHDSITHSVELNSDNFSVPQGLSQSTVTSIAEDQQGYVWVGTLNGLNRFDGQQFKAFLADEQSGLKSSFIRSLSTSSSGELLVGTDQGIMFYDKQNDKFESLKIAQQFSQSAIWAILNTSAGLVIGTNTGLYLVNENGTIANTKKPLYEAKNIVQYHNDIYVRNYNRQLYKLSLSEFEQPPELVANNIIDITQDQDTLYVLSSSDITTLANGESTKLATSKQYSKIFVRDNHLFGITNHQVFLIENGIETLFGSLKEENNSVVSALYVNKNAIYIGLVNDGLISISNSANLINTIVGTTGNIWNLSKKADGNLLLSSDSSAINEYDEHLNLIATHETGLTGYKNSVFFDSSIFVGNHQGLFRFDIESEELQQVYSGTITYLKTSHFHSALILATSTGEVLQFQPERGVSTLLSLPVKTPILSILETSATEYFIGGQAGLYKAADNNVELVDKGLVYSVGMIDENQVVYGTSTSIRIYDRTRQLSTTRFDNNKSIYSIVVEDGRLIASSINEIVYLVNDKSYVFSTKYGSQHEYNTPSGIGFNQDTVIFGGIEGASLISIAELDRYINNIPVIETTLTDLLIFNTAVAVGSEHLKAPLSYAEEVTLKYSDYPFTIKFDTPNSSTEEIEYYYQLLGLSDDWIAAKGTKSATYTNLSSGVYTFNIYAQSALLSEPGKVKSLIINITPPWWLSTESKIVYFLIVMLFAGVFTKALLRRREVQRQIAKSEERLKLSLWGSGDEMWDWDIETGQIYRSNIWGSLEFPRDGQRSGDGSEESNIHPMDQERVSSALNKHFTGECDHFEAAYRVKGKADEWVWILDRAKIVERDEQDKPVRMTGTIKNINNFKQAEEQLRLFERAIENISEGMFILDSEFNFVEVNEACCDLCEKSRSDFIGIKLNFDLYPDSYSEQIHAILQQQGSWSNDVESSKGDGSSFLMELTIDAIYDEQGALSHFVGVFSDISRRKQQEEELRKLTNNDLLTSLPNRSSLMVTLGNLVRKDTHHTLMVLDLDNFKKINDSLGHQVGDELLKMVALRIEAAVPYHTSIYRLGGDEFAILVDNNPDIGSAAVIANSVIDAFNNPFDLSNDRVVVGVSIGIVLYPEDDQNEQALLRKADIAMYHAKSGGGNRYQFYSESLNRNAIRQLEVENLIREGLKEDLFEVYYQPKIDLKSGKLAGMEALVRLNHPQHGLIPPGDFIPLAEETGLIIDIGEVVLKKACFAAQNWRRQGIFNGRVAVNLSSQQFALPDLHQRIESILRLTQLPASNLELEITEGTVIKQPEKAIKVMDQLSQMGVSLALDDFGTGYSSLSYLKRFPIHTLKIDKAFVDDIDKSDRDLKMVDSIITIAHNMGLSVVGEGVEEASQLSILKALKCEEIQGFIYSKAVTEERFSKLLIQEHIEPQKHIKQANSGPKM